MPTPQKNESYKFIRDNANEDAESDWTISIKNCRFTAEERSPTMLFLESQVFLIYELAYIMMLGFASLA